MQMSEQILFYLAQDVIRKDMVNKQPNSVARDFEIENGVLKKYIGNDSAVVIPNGVTEIAEYAFDGCDSLKSIEIPVGVKSVDSSAFYYCDALESITVARGNAVYHSNGNCLIETASKTLVLGCKNSIIPADGSVKSIGELAFSGCDLLTNIKIPNCVTKIGFMAFYCCVSLTNIELPDGLTDIGANAFECCESLTDIKIPKGVTSIGDRAFWMCALLENIEIPENCALGYDCFPEHCKVIKA